MQTSYETFKTQLKSSLSTMSRLKNLQYHHHPRDSIYHRDKVTLYHYRPLKAVSSQPPLLLVFSTVNRPEILELQPENSLIGGLLKKGVDVYLLDWGYPDANDSHLSLHDYIHHYLQPCVDITSQTSGHAQINLLGICQGGILSACFASQSNKIAKLILISTPIDFHTRDNVITKVVRQLDIDAITTLTGNIAGTWLAQFFISLRPFELIGKKYLKLLDHLSDQAWVERFLRVEKWLHDAPDQPGNAFSAIVKQCYQENKLIKGQMQIGNKYINLANINVPVLNIMARDDEIVPVSASRALKKMIDPGFYTQKIIAGGHIGIYISPAAVKRLVNIIHGKILQDA